MSSILTRLIVSGVALSLLGSAVHAADPPNAAELKMRESLRATTLQLRNAETERATLQAAQAASLEENKALTEKLEALTKQAAANQAEAEKAAADLGNRLTRKEMEAGDLQIALDKWKKGHAEVTEIARKKEAERATFAARVIVLDRQVADQQVRNAAMFKIGNEILARYEGFGLGTALTAREPFIGTTRVKLQNLFQDYSDKLADERIKPTPAPPAPGAPASKKKAKPAPEKPRNRKIELQG